MFPSVSRTIPNTLTTTTFTASRAMNLEVVSTFVIKVNGFQPVNPASVSISAGDVVVAEFTTPTNFLWHSFFYYKIDGVPQSFACVNRSEYTLKVRSQDAERRWYLYSNDNHRLTFKTAGGVNNNLVLGDTSGSVFGTFHIILDPVSDSIYFYSTSTILLNKATFTASPIEYLRNPLRDSVLVLVQGGEMYEVFLFNPGVDDLPPFISLRNFSEFTGDLTYLTRLPGEDLITYLRRLRARRSIPPATCMTAMDIYLIAGGNGTVWVVDLSVGFRLENLYEIDEYIQNIVAMPGIMKVMLITQSQKIYTMTLDGTFTEIYQGAALWQPSVFNGRVYIPETNNEGNTAVTIPTDGRLLVYNIATESFEAPINFTEFCPSYTTVDNNKLYVCGHDSERVMVFDSAMQMTTLYFPDKVTWVSAVNDTVIASHYLSQYKILLAPDLFRVIEIDFDPRRGPVSHIGTNTEIIRTLGSDEVYGRTPENTWLWVNGRRSQSDKPQGVILLEGDYVSISHAARFAGNIRTNCVIGDTAYDYDMEAVAQTYYPRHIDFPIQGIGDSGIHSRTVILPRFFTPCLMSLEYGTLRVNGALYYGYSLVYPTDEVTIEVRTCKTADALNSVLPILTLGLRQYVVPISANITAPTIQVVDDNLAPNTQLTKTETLTSTTSRADFIIPGYYDLRIKKNNVDITGNYYQQFGVNDQLVVEYSSSRKRYDELDVYILGAPNYKFTAKNVIEQKINFLDYGIISYPYPRVYDIVYQNIGYDLTPQNQFANVYAENEYQYQTSNLTVTGLSSGILGNIFLNAIDGFFVLNGEIKLDEYIEVQTGDQLALVRNITNFYEESVTIKQLLPDPEDDFYVEVSVGTWGVINQEITQGLITTRNYYANSTNEIRLVDNSYFESIVPTALELSRINNVIPEPNRPEVYTGQPYELDSVAEKQSQGAIIERIIDIEISHIGDCLSLARSFDPNNVGNNVLGKLNSDLDRPSLRSFQAYELKFLKDSINTDNRLSNENDLINYLTTDGLKLKQYLHFPIIPDKLIPKIIEKNTQAKQFISASYVTNSSIEYPTSRLINDRQKLSVDPGSTPINYGQQLRIANSSTGQHLTSRLIIENTARYESLTGNFLFTNASQPNINRVEYFIQYIYRPMLDSIFYKNLDAVGPNKITYNYINSTFNYLQRSIETYTVAPASGTIIETYQYTNDYLIPKYTTARDYYDKSPIWQGYIFNYYIRPEWERATNIINFMETDRTSFLRPDLKYADTQPSQSASLVKNVSVLDPQQFVKIDFKIGETTPSAPGTLLHKDAIPGAQNFINLKINYPDADESVPEALVRKDKIISKGGAIKLKPNYPDADESVPEHLILKYDTHNRILGEKRSTSYPKNNSMVSKKYIRGLEYYKTTDFEKIIFADPARDRFNPEYLEIISNYNFNEFKRTQPANYFPAISISDDMPRASISTDITNFDRFKVVDKISTGFLSAAEVQAELRAITLNFLYNRSLLFMTDNFGLNREKTSFQFALGSQMVNERYGTKTLLDPFSVLEMTDNGMITLTGNGNKLDREIKYTSMAPTVKFVKGELWDHDIEVMYGAFETEEDAIKAAEKYTNFRPYLILNTSLWTYRVLFDTGVVCPLPPGRYPIAWLIRGG